MANPALGGADAYQTVFQLYYHLKIMVLIRNTHIMLMKVMYLINL